MISLKDRRLFCQLESALLEELDRQNLNGEIDPGALDQAFFDPVDGDLCGRPDWWRVVAAVIEEYRDGDG